jgi:hypothetical protein
MYGAGAYIRSAFPDLPHAGSQELLGEWMRTFLERHPSPETPTDKRTRYKALAQDSGDPDYPPGGVFNRGLPRKPIARRTPVKKRNPKRRASEFARSYHSKARVEFVKGLPCVTPDAFCWGGIENAHVGGKGAGTGRKADSDQTAPMCRYHHRDVFHRYGARFLEREFGINLEAAAAATETAWLRHTQGEE